MTQVKCPFCKTIQEIGEKAEETKLIESFFKTQAYKKCNKCGEMFKRDNNKVESEDGR